MDGYLLQEVGDLSSTHHVRGWLQGGNQVKQKLVTSQFRLKRAFSNYCGIDLSQSRSTSSVGQGTLTLADPLPFLTLVRLYYGLSEKQVKAAESPGADVTCCAFVQNAVKSRVDPHSIREGRVLKKIPLACNMVLFIDFVRVFCFTFEPLQRVSLDKLNYLLWNYAILLEKSLIIRWLIFF